MATFLATQDNPARGLCSNEPAITPHGPEGDLESKNSDLIPISTTKVRETPSQHGDVSGNAGSPHKKDFKSFTQTLFDTVSMKRLQITKVPVGFSKWRLGRNTAEAALSVDDWDNAVKTDKRQSDDEPRFEDSFQQERLSHGGDSKAADSESSKVIPRGTGLDIKSFMPGLWPIVDERFRATFIVPDLASVGAGSQFASELGQDYRKIDTGLTQSVSAHSAQGSRSELPKTPPSSPNGDNNYLVDDQLPNMPASADSRPTMPPQTLSRFTLENIAALSLNFKVFKPNIPDEQNFVASCGPLASILPLDSLISGTATRREREIAFITQSSIIYVLSSPEPLLKSFRDSDSVSEDAKDEFGFLKIVHAFTLLFQVDSLERYVFSSLLDVANKLYPPKFDCPEKSNMRGNLRPEPLQSNTRFENPPTGEMALNDDEAMHITKIGLAALVARVSKVKGHGQAWFSFCEAHANGRSTNQDTHRILMDIFDDQLCIELMTVLVKALVLRKYISENARYRESQLIDSENHQYSPETIINKLLYNIFHLSPSAGIIPLHEPERLEIIRHHAEILLQWLRSVISKSWDGKAVIQRRGAVGCALEFMSYLGEFSFPMSFVFQSLLTFFSSDV